MMLLGSFTFVMAQQSPTNNEQRDYKRMEKQKEHLDKLQQNLGLNDAQVAKIKDLQNKMKSSEMGDRKTKMQNYNAAMQNILTPDQFAKWQAKRAEMQDKMKDRRMNTRRAMQNTNSQ